MYFRAAGTMIIEQRAEGIGIRGKLSHTQRILRAFLKGRELHPTRGRLRAND